MPAMKRPAAATDNANEAQQIVEIDGQKFTLPPLGGGLPGMEGFDDAKTRRAAYGRLQTASNELLDLVVISYMDTLFASLCISVGCYFLMGLFVWLCHAMNMYLACYEKLCAVGSVYV